MKQNDLVQTTFTKRELITLLTAIRQKQKDLKKLWDNYLHDPEVDFDFDEDYFMQLEQKIFNLIRE